MDYNNQILSDIVELSKLTVNNPRYNYYQSRALLNIRIGYESGKITLEESISLTAEFRRVMYSEVNTTRTVLSYFEVHLENKENLFQNCELDDILNCRDLCINFSKLDNAEVLKAICSDSSAKSGLEISISRFKELYKESSNDLYDTIRYLDRNLLNCLYRTNLMGLAKDVAKEYLPLREELLERDKHFYYHPREDTSSMKNSIVFSNEKLDEYNSINYYDYHFQKYAIKLLEMYCSNPMNPRGNLMDITEFIENSDLLEEIKDKLIIQIGTYIGGLLNQDYKTLIVSSRNLPLESICFYDFNTLLDALTIAVQFCKQTTKDSLINFAISFAIFSQFKQGAANYNYLTYNTALESGLDKLIKYSVIDESEGLEILINNRKGDK